MNLERAILLVLLAASRTGRPVKAAIILARLPEFTGSRETLAEVQAALDHMERMNPPQVQGVSGAEGEIFWQITTAGKGRAVAE